MISRKYFYSVALGLMTLLTASCSQDDSLVEPVHTKEASASFSVNIPQESTGTRAADANVQRYAIAIEDADGNTVSLAANSGGWKVDTTNGDGKMKIQSTGSFVIDGLTDGNTYTAHFWADYDSYTLPTDWQETGDYATYDISWYNYVKLNWQGANLKPAIMAYCGSKEFIAGSDNGAGFDITLKRAVAQVSLIQNDAKENVSGTSFEFKCYSGVVYNIKTGTASTSDADKGTVSYWPSISGSNVADGEEIFNFYILANQGINDNDITYADFYLTRWSGSSYVSCTGADYGFLQTTVKANHITNIKGNFFGD
jgi:hypothetical protein